MARATSGVSSHAAYSRAREGAWGEAVVSAGASSEAAQSVSEHLERVYVTLLTASRHAGQILEDRWLYHTDDDDLWQRRPAGIDACRRLLKWRWGSGVRVDVRDYGVQMMLVQDSDSTGPAETLGSPP